MTAVKATYFLEIQSSWCFWAEPTWQALKERFADRVEFGWRIALMPPEAFPASKEENEGYYRRSGTVIRSGFMLNAGWFEAELKGDYRAANRVAEAGKDLGVTDDRMRLALSRAALVEGRKIGRLEEAVAVAAEACQLEAAVLQKAACSKAVEERVEASTRAFYAYQIDQRPAFVLESSIGDKAVFSGVIGLEPLAATIEGMLADVAGYGSYHAHFGVP